MNTMKFLSISLLLLALVSCNKEETPAAKTQLELLTQKNWKIISIIDKSDGQQLFEACKADDLYTFTKSGARYYHTGVTICTSENSSATSWAFTPSQSGIIFGGNTYPLEKLTEDSLIYLYTFFEYKFVH